MHKHRTSRGTAIWRNANCRIPESASVAVQSILGSIGQNDDFATSYLHSQYLSKYCDESLTPADTRRSAAIQKWLEQEEKNGTTNTRFSGVIDDRGNVSFSGPLDRNWNILPYLSLSRFLQHARSLVASVLGPLNDSVVLGSYSGGASTSRRRTSSTPAEKFAGQADATASAVPFIDILYREATLLRQFGLFNTFRVVRGAELFTVPKKTDIDRCACKEPDINMYLQKGVGRVIRSRLRRFNINLNDQSVNRRLAQEGSVSLKLATLDLSSASDSICCEVVKALLPHDWYLYLNDIRSQEVLVEGDYIRTEMFSSMGNGFTFELESLIFWALCSTTCYLRGIPGVISVYGDDIICPDGAADDLDWIFSTFGFKINQDKSFSTYHGQVEPFRESCGGHYHAGRDVTPFFLKRRATHLTDVIRVANQLRRWASIDPSREHSLPNLYSTWRQLADFVPKDLWGGRDFASDTQLVSPDFPRKRLVRLSGKKKLPESGRYLHWHNSNWNRGSEAGEAYEASDTSTLCRMRPAPIGAPYLDYQFYEELMV